METSNYISADPTVLKRTKKEKLMVSPSLTLCDVQCLAPELAPETSDPELLTSLKVRLEN